MTGRIPADLAKALKAAPKTKAAWDSLTPIARRDFVTWIQSAKQPETRKRRVEKAGSMLRSGKRRPCCYAVVPMGLYTALDANARAKAHWKALTPDERRDVTAWVDAASNQVLRDKRIQQACLLLAAGKKTPRD